MNKLFPTATFVLALAMAALFAVSAFAQDKKDAKGEEFFIVASIDRAKSQILLKHPTEVTTLLNVNEKTRVLGADGKVIPLTDLRAGDTVWVVSSGRGQGATAVEIRMGPMTQAELHRYYLDYPEIK
jgi:hypothetical protein